jgi:putative Mg2+ transporter-C (MgtC) family protein
MTLLQTALPDTLYGMVDLPMLGRLVLAAILGGVVGLEREVSGKPAGLRTNLLICVGASLLMELSIGVAAFANAANLAEGVPFRADPARIAAQIVSGIGFLGAGTILQARGSVVGLTTAATIWVVAAIGMAVGAQAYWEATGATLLVVLALVGLGRLEGFVQNRWGTHRYVVVTEPDAGALEQVETLFRTDGLRVATSSIDKAGDHFEAVFVVTGPSALRERAIRRLVARDEVRRVTREI